MADVGRPFQLAQSRGLAVWEQPGFNWPLTVQPSFLVESVGGTLQIPLTECSYQSRLVDLPPERWALWWEAENQLLNIFVNFTLQMTFTPLALHLVRFRLIVIADFPGLPLLNFTSDGTHDWDPDEEVENGPYVDCDWSGGNPFFVPTYYRWHFLLTIVPYV